MHEWCRRIPGWSARPRVVLQDEVAEIFCRAVCTWAGVPIADRDVPRLAARLGWFLEPVSAVGPRYVRGRVSHRDRDGQLLDAHIAGVELLTLLRTTTAVSWFVADAALALHEHPEWRSRLRAGDDPDRWLFVQEVRLHRVRPRGFWCSPMSCVVPKCSTAGWARRRFRVWRRLAYGGRTS